MVRLSSFRLMRRRADDVDQVVEHAPEKISTSSSPWEDKVEKPLSSTVLLSSVPQHQRGQEGGGGWHSRRMFLFLRGRREGQLDNGDGKDNHQTNHEDGEQQDIEIVPANKLSFFRRQNSVPIQPRKETASMSLSSVVSDSVQEMIQESSATTLSKAKAAANAFRRRKSNSDHHGRVRVRKIHQYEFDYSSDDNVDHDEISAVQEPFNRNSNHSSTWDDYHEENRQRNRLEQNQHDHTHDYVDFESETGTSEPVQNRSQSGASMIRLLIQQQHDERRAEQKRIKQVQKQHKDEDQVAPETMNDMSGNLDGSMNRLNSHEALEEIVFENSPGASSSQRSIGRKTSLVSTPVTKLKSVASESTPALSLIRSVGSRQLGFNDSSSSSQLVPTLASPRMGRFHPDRNNVIVVPSSPRNPAAHYDDLTDDDDLDDEPPLFLRQKPVKGQLGKYREISVGQSPLHPKQYTQSNHVLVNYEREKRQLHLLRRNVYIDNLARQHAERMAQQRRLFHSVSSIEELQQQLGPFPSTFTSTTTTIAAPSSGPTATTSSTTVFHVAENILRGSSVKAIHDETMFHFNHPDRKNILSAHFTEFGMGTAIAHFEDDDNVGETRTTNTEPVLYMVQLFRSTPPPHPHDDTPS